MPPVPATLEGARGAALESALPGDLHECPQGDLGPVLRQAEMAEQGSLGSVSGPHHERAGLGQLTSCPPRLPQ